MGKRRSRLKERIELRRQQGQLPTAIARYVHNKGGTSWSKKFHWTLPEREELERLDREAAERKAQKAKKLADAAEAAARQARARRASLPPCPPISGRRALSNLKRKGLSPTAVREILGCSATELDRWAEDRRLPPDGVRFYYGVGPLGGSKWGRAWLLETVHNAKAFVDEWRARDIAEIVRRWVSEASLFDLVWSRFPDAVRQWKPDWLDGQSVDIYVPAINVAFEYQGEQHYKPVAFFGGEKGFWDGQARDARKREHLTRQGVALIEWRFDRPVVGAELDRALAFVKCRDDLAAMRC
jgi:hypothetical protein